MRPGRHRREERRGGRPTKRAQRHPDTACPGRSGYGFGHDVSPRRHHSCPTERAAPRGCSGRPRDRGGVHDARPSRRPRHRPGGRGDIGPRPGARELLRPGARLGGLRVVPVRRPHRAHRLRRPERRGHHHQGPARPRPQPGQATRLTRRQPGRARRVGRRLRDRSGQHRRPFGPLLLRRRRLRPARRGSVRADRLPRRHGPRRVPRDRPDPRRRGRGARAAQGGRDHGGRLPEPQPRPHRARGHRRRGQGHGRAPRGARRRAPQLPRQVVRHLPRGDLRRPLPGPGGSVRPRRRRAARPDERPAGRGPGARFRARDPRLRRGLRHRGRLPPGDVGRRGHALDPRLPRRARPHPAAHRRPRRAPAHRGLGLPRARRRDVRPGRLGHPHGRDPGGRDRQRGLPHGARQRLCRPRSGRVLHREHDGGHLGRQLPRPSGQPGPVDLRGVREGLHRGRPHVGALPRVGLARVRRLAGSGRQPAAPDLGRGEQPHRRRRDDPRPGHDLRVVEAAA